MRRELMARAAIGVSILLAGLLWQGVGSVIPYVWGAVAGMVALLLISPGGET